MKELKYPKKSHRKSILLPSDSVSLAELMGIVLGDGGINNDWQLTISLNYLKDKEFAVFVSDLLERLFKIDVKFRKRPDQNTLVLVCSSMNLVDFLVSKGAVRGNKIAQNIDMPKWIYANEVFEKAFVRGLVDTDGCLYIHKHSVEGKKYQNIGFCFTSFSKKLLNTVSAVLRKNGIKPYITDGGKRIYLYSFKAVEKYLEIFGSNNHRIIEQYNSWRDARVV